MKPEILGQALSLILLELWPIIVRLQRATI